MTTRTYPLPLPEAGDPRFTAALVDDVSRVLGELHGLPPVAGRDFVALGDALHGFLFGVPAPDSATPEPPPLPLAPAEGECPRCRSTDRVETGAVRAGGDRRDMRCACGWSWSVHAGGDGDE